MPELRPIANPAMFKPIHSLAAAMIVSLGLTSLTPAWSAPANLDKRLEAAAVKKEDHSKIVPDSSDMDGDMFLQVLVAEVQANAGDRGTAYQIYLELARQHKSSQLYQRAVTLALQGRAGEQALTAAKAWRQAFPNSREASEYTVQILLALDRSKDLAPHLRAMIQQTAAPQQPQLLLAAPRMLFRLTDKAAAARVLEEASEPWRTPPLELAEAWIAMSESFLLAKDNPNAYQALLKAAKLKPDHAMVGLLASDLMADNAAAEQIILSQLGHADSTPLVRLAYARRLAAMQRMPEAAQQLEQLVQLQPKQSTAWLTLGLVRFEQGQLEAAEKALFKVLEINGQAARAGTASSRKGSQNSEPAVQITTSDEGDTDVSPNNGPKGELEQANLLLSQIAEKQGKLDLAVQWLQLADPKQAKLAIQNQRSQLLARQGKLEQARAVVRAIPEAEPQDGVTKVQLEAQLLREAKQLSEAQKVLNAGIERFPDEPDLMYDLAMICERLKQFERMESLLQRVMELNPDDPNAFNALGYSLADRNIRLDEARTLLEKALALRPADPFITDSLAWLEYRQGNVEQATKLLQQALAAKQDGEIAAHLIEVLWQTGQQDEARKVLKQALASEPGSEPVKNIVQKLKITAP